VAWRRGWPGRPRGASPGARHGADARADRRVAACGRVDALGVRAAVASQGDRPGQRPRFRWDGCAVRVRRRHPQPRRGLDSVRPVIQGCAARGPGNRADRRQLRRDRASVSHRDPRRGRRLPGHRRRRTARPRGRAAHPAQRPATPGGNAAVKLRDLLGGGGARSRVAGQRRRDPRPGRVVRARCCLVHRASAAARRQARRFSWSHRRANRCAQQREGGRVGWVRGQDRPSVVVGVRYGPTGWRRSRRPRGTIPSVPRSRRGRLSHGRWRTS
jgi:hypothetical protein